MRGTTTEITDERMREAKRDAAVLVKIIRILEPLTPRQRWWVMQAVRLKIEADMEP